MLKKVFGTLKNSPKKSKLVQALQNVAETEGKLLERREKLEKEIEAEMSRAKQNAKQNKKVAMQALKKKKRLCRELEKVNHILDNLEQPKSALEAANLNSLAVSAMETTSKALKTAHKKVSVDKVDDLFDKLDEANNQVEDITSALGGASFDEQEWEDEELLKELEELEGVGELPQVPLSPVEPIEPAVGKRTPQVALSL